MQSQEDIARAAVIASSSEESVLGRDSSEESDKAEQAFKSVKSVPKEGTKEKKDRKRKIPGSSSSEDRRPKSKKLSLLSMRLTESDSSAEERKYRARMEKRNAKGNGAGAEKNGASRVARFGHCISKGQRLDFLTAKMGPPPDRN